MAEDDYCYVTTTGRVSGDPHEIEIWYVRVDDTLYLLSGGGDRSDWVRNLTQARDCVVRFARGAAPNDAHARLLTEQTNESERARELVFGKYQARSEDDLRKWRIESLPIALDLAEADGA
jgi:deazaflavin-dependent oxidoreductase (nitroreductase family)